MKAKQIKRLVLLFLLLPILFLMWTRQDEGESEKIKMEIEKNKNDLKKIKQELESSGDEKSSNLEEILKLELTSYENKVIALVLLTRFFI